MGSILKEVSFCFVALFLAMNGAVAETPASLSISKIDFSFETRIRVQVKGRVAEAEEAKLIGANTTYTQSLTYIGRSGRDANRTFASLAELRLWLENEACSEIHEVDLRPIRELGVRGDQSFRGRLKPFTVRALGKDHSVPEKALSEMVVCKRSPKAE